MRVPEVTNKFPRLGNYPHDATKEELVAYVSELIEWCTEIEESCCGHERPPRKVLCQLPECHEGSHRAVVYWEDE